MTSESTLTLGSTSPRRAELLRQIGLEFSTLAPDIDESVRVAEAPNDFVVRMSNDKFLALESTEGLSSGAVLLTADTIVVHLGQILGKPVDQAEAISMLRKLSGDRHQVMTSVTIGRKGGHKEQFLVETNVQFRTLTDMEIRNYWDTGEPADKAGAYGIQGLGAVLVESIEGSYSNVVGLPLTETALRLADFNIAVLGRP